MDDGRVRTFLTCYIPDLAEALWEEIVHHARGLLDLVRNPYFLIILVWTYAIAEEKNLPSNPGQLLSSLVARLLEREQQRAHPDWIDADAFEQVLSVLAWVLQEQGEGTSLPIEEARVVEVQSSRFFQRTGTCQYRVCREAAWLEAFRFFNRKRYQNIY